MPLTAPFGPAALHLCVDMQRLFGDDTAWHMPWLRRVLPQVVRLCERVPERTAFTRFIPPEHKDQLPGVWRRYYARWSSMTLGRLHPDLLRLMPELEAFVPPAQVFDKQRYAAFSSPALCAYLNARKIDTLVISGGETDVCVLATVMQAVDLGYRVVLVTDALCSFSDQTHDALLTLYHQRFTEQIETTTVAEALACWDEAKRRLAG